MGKKVNKVERSAANTPQVDFALLLRRWIEAVEDDPARMRSAIYELARLKLQRATFLVDPPVSRADARRIMLALEVAIDRVEMQALECDELGHVQERDELGHVQECDELRHVQECDELRHAQSARQLVTQVDPPGISQAQLATLRTLEPVIEILDGEPRRINVLRPRPEESQLRIWSVVGRGAIVVLAVVAAAAFVSVLRETGRSVPPVNNAGLTSDSARPAPLTTDPVSTGAKPARPLQSASLPLPGIYGVYALCDGQLRELEGLPGTVPDPRVFMSTAINKPSHTVLADGRVEFVIYRRDIASSAPDKIAVRAVAKIPRAITFNAAGKPTTAAVDDAWTIRNISYDFNVAPVSDNPELILVRPETPDFAFPAGRYALVVKGVGYDFTVAGPITDPAQCLESVAAANGTFYAECKRP